MEKLIRFFKILLAGLILACFWVLIATIFSGSLELTEGIRSFSFLLWCVSFLLIIGLEIGAL